MSDDARRNREVAVSLMRMALPLLDRSGEPCAAARLQHAIDTVEGQRNGRTGAAAEARDE